MQLAGDAPRIEVLKMGERHPLMRLLHVLLGLLVYRCELGQRETRIGELSDFSGLSAFGQPRPCLCELACDHLGPGARRLPPRLRHSGSPWPERLSAHRSSSVGGRGDAQMPDTAQ
eukprot:scaffold12931_cov122-Isochrysis_galbana.AAC.2